MNIQIFLILIGIILLIASFIIPERLLASSKSSENEILSADLHNLLVQELKNSNGEIVNIISDAAENVELEAKRKLEYLTNEKIMAINEFSDQVMDGINKNHGEVMFLYGMLNEKEEEIRQLLEQAYQVKQGGSRTQIQDFIKKQKDEPEQNTIKNEQLKQSTRTVTKAKEAITEELGENLDSAFRFLEAREFQENENYEEQQKIAFSISNNEATTKTARKRRTSTPSSKNKADENLKEVEGLNSEFVLKLYDEGNDVKEIAKQLQVGVGEVKLVVGLNRGAK